MKRFFLYANPGKPETLPAVKAFANLLIDHGCIVYLDCWLHDQLLIGNPSDLEQLDSGIDAVISFGGDGTILRVLPRIAVLQIPVLGVNMGHTGFLLELTPEELPGITQRLIAGDYQVERRAMLDCRINGNRHYLVMNELALTRGQNPSSLVVDVFFRDELVYTIHGDGVLVCSPTGTTGYSLSAGGPVLYPTVPCQVVVPICSHIMTQRPVVLPGSGEVRLSVRANRGMMHQVSLDGQVIFDYDINSEISISAAEQSAGFIRFAPQRFLTRLHQKQMEWSTHVYGGKV